MEDLQRNAAVNPQEDAAPGTGGNNSCPGNPGSPIPTRVAGHTYRCLKSDGFWYTAFGTADYVKDPTASDVAAANTYTAAGTGAVQRSLSDRAAETISVKDFGAKCDWSGAAGTDDTNSFQLAASAANARYAATGAAVTVQVSGTCKIAGPVLYGSGVHWLGPAALYLPVQNPSPVLGARDADDVAIDGITVLPPGSYATACQDNNADCVAIDYSTTSASSAAHKGVRISNVKVHDSNWGIRISATNGTGTLSDVHIDQVTVDSSSPYTQYDGAHIQGAVTNWSVTNSHFTNRGDAAIAASSEPTGRLCSGGVISGNTGFDDLIGIDISGCSNVLVSNNNMRATATVANANASNPGFRAMSYGSGVPTGLNVTGNTFLKGPGTGENDAKFDLRGTGSHVTGSTFTNNTLRTLYTLASNLTVAENTFLDGAHWGCDYFNGIATDGIQFGPNTWQGIGGADCSGNSGYLTNDYWYPQRGNPANLTFNVGAMTQVSAGAGSGTVNNATVGSAPALAGYASSGNAIGALTPAQIIAAIGPGSFLLPGNNASDFADKRAAVSNLGFPYINVDLAPSSCTVSGTSYATSTECAFYMWAKPAVGTFNSVSMFFGDHVYYVKAPLKLPNANGHSVHFIGTGSATTNIYADPGAAGGRSGAAFSPIGDAIIQEDYQTGQSLGAYFKGIGIHGSALGTCFKLEQIRNVRVDDVICDTPAEGSWWPVKFGAYLTGDAQEITINNLYIAGSLPPVAGQALLTATVNSDGTLTPNTPTGGTGAGYIDASHTVVTIRGTGHGDVPCTNMGTNAAVVSGGKLTSWSTTASGCLPIGATLAVAADTVTNVNAGFFFAVSDASIYDLYVTGFAVGGESWYGNTDYEHFHPTNVITALKLHHAASFDNLECDEVSLHCIDNFAPEPINLHGMTAVTVSTSVGNPGGDLVHSNAGSGAVRILNPTLLCNGGIPAGYNLWLTTSGPVVRDASGKILNAIAGSSVHGIDTTCGFQSSVGDFDTNPLSIMAPVYAQSITSDSGTFGTLQASKLCTSSTNGVCNFPGGNVGYFDAGTSSGALGGYWNTRSGSPTRTLRGFGSTTAQENVVWHLSPYTTAGGMICGTLLSNQPSGSYLMLNNNLTSGSATWIVGTGYLLGGSTVHTGNTTLTTGQEGCLSYSNGVLTMKNMTTGVFNTVTDNTIPPWGYNGFEIDTRYDTNSAWSNVRIVYPPVTVATFPWLQDRPRSESTTTETRLRCAKPTTPTLPALRRSQQPLTPRASMRGL